MRFDFFLEIDIFQVNKILKNHLSEFILNFFTVYKLKVIIAQRRRFCNFGKKHFHVYTQLKRKVNTSGII